MKDSDRLLRDKTLYLEKEIKVLKEANTAHQELNGLLRKQIENIETAIKKELKDARTYYKGNGSYAEDAIYRIWREI